MTPEKIKMENKIAKLEHEITELKIDVKGLLLKQKKCEDAKMLRWKIASIIIPLVTGLALVVALLMI